MTFPFPYGGITVTVERGALSRFNDFTYVDHHTIDGCVEYPSSSDEAGQNVGITDVRTLLVPPGEDVEATDRIVLHEPGSAIPPTGDARKDATYQVIGRPKDWVHAMSGWNPGMTVQLQKVT